MGVKAKSLAPKPTNKKKNKSNQQYKIQSKTANFQTNKAHTTETKTTNIVNYKTPNSKRTNCLTVKNKTERVKQERKTS